MATITNKHPKIIEPNPEEPSEDLLSLDDEQGSGKETIILIAICVVLMATAVVVVLWR